MESMHSIIQFSMLKEGNRLDADRYQPKYLELENQLRSISCVEQLSELISEPVHTGHTPKDRELDEDSEKICFIKTDTLREGFIVFENVDFLPSTSITKKHYLRQNDVIVTIIGATNEVVGRASIFLENYPCSVVNQNIAIIRVDAKQINPFFLSIFLNSKYGREQLWMLSRQTEQVNLNCREVERLLIPKFSIDFQNEIEALYTTALNSIANSKRIYLHAKATLQKETDLDVFKLNYTKTYTRNFLDVVNAKRLDAQYFQPIYDELLEHLRKRFEIKKLQQLLSGSPKKGIEVGSNNYQEEGKPFLRVSDLSINGFTRKDPKYINEELYYSLEDQYSVKNGDFLLTKDATPGTAYLVKESVEGILSSGILRLKINPKEIEQEYLVLCINSLIGCLQVERETGGSVIVHWRPDQIKELEIPMLPRNIQQRISQLVTQSFEERNKAYNLFDKAIETVENQIDKTCSDSS